MNSPLRKISAINDELDVKLFLYIARKNFFFPIIFCLIAVAGSWIYLRYTPPVYQTSAIIQLGPQSQAPRLIPTASIHENDLAQQHELMRSSVFLYRALSRLPLDISYFAKGRVLNNELYRNSPFKVQAEQVNPNMYGVPIHVEFTTAERITLSFYLAGQYHEREIRKNEWNQLPEMKLYMEVSDLETLRAGSLGIVRNSFFFIVNNPEALVARYSDKIRINILNAAAKTIQVSYQGNNAQKASDIVNSILDEFNLFDLEKRAESANSILEFIDRQLVMLFDMLSESEIKLREFREEHNIDDAAITPLPSIHGRISDFENQLAQLELEKTIVSQIEKTLRNEDDIDAYGIIAVLSGSEFQNGMSGMLASFQGLLLEREKLLYQVTPSSRQVEAVNFQIDIHKRVMLESIATIKRNIEVRQNDLRRRIGEFEQYMADKTGNLSLLQYSMIQREHSINERFYNQLVEKKAEYSISKAGLVSQSVILERSITPKHPIAPIPRAVYSGSLLAALFLGLGVILLRYLFYTKILSLNDVVKYTNASVLGVIPKYQNEIPQNQILVHNKPKSLIAESLRAIRTNLQFIDNSEGPKLIAITSTISSEGKTFFAMNLAGILAFSNKRVIVIDLDMRMPKIHLGFNVVNDKGISTILSNINDIDSCIRSSKIKNLDFITAGPPPPNPSELILTPQMALLIDNLKSKYDFVIVDNPPVGIVTDGMQSIIMADYPIYILKANYSDKLFIQNINMIMHENHVAKLSVVLNAVDKEYSSYAHEKGYSYGYYYYDSADEHGYYDDQAISPKRRLWNRILRLWK